MGGLVRGVGQTQPGGARRGWNHPVLMRTLSPALHNLSLCPILSVPPSSREAEPLVRNLRGSSPWNEKWQWLSDKKTRKRERDRSQRGSLRLRLNWTLDPCMPAAEHRQSATAGRGVAEGKLRKFKCSKAGLVPAVKTGGLSLFNGGIYPLPGQSSPFTFRFGEGAELCTIQGPRRQIESDRRAISKPHSV